MPSAAGNFSWSLAGTVVYNGCQWLTLAILAKLGDREMVGQFALGLALTAPIMLLANVALNNVQVIDARRDYEFREYLGLRVLTTSAALVAIAAFAMASPYPRSTAAVIFIVGISKAIDSLTDIFLGLLLQHQQLKRSARVWIVNGVVSVAAITVAVLIWRSAVAAAIATAFGSLVALVLVGVPSAAVLLRADAGAQGRRSSLAAILRPSIDPARAWRLVSQAAPLGVIGMLGALNAAIPRYFLARLGGAGLVGTFAALASLAAIGTLVNGALGQMAAPRLAGYYASGNGAAFVRLTWRLLALSAGFAVASGLGAWALGRPVLALAYRPEYAERNDVFVWLVASQALLYVAGTAGVAITAMRVFRVQVPVQVANSGVLLVLFACWIRGDGLLGAAQASLAGSALLTAAYGVLARISMRRLARRAS